MENKQPLDRKKKRNNMTHSKCIKAYSTFYMHVSKLFLKNLLTRDQSAEIP